MSATIASLQPGAATTLLAGGSGLVDAESQNAVAEPFAALFQQLIGQQAAVDPTAGLLLQQGDVEAGTSQVAADEEGLAALLPFLEAMGLAQPQALSSVPAQETAQSLANSASGASTAAAPVISAARSSDKPANPAGLLSNQNGQNSEASQALTDMQAIKPESTGHTALSLQNEGESANTATSTTDFQTQMNAAMSDGHDNTHAAAQHGNMMTATSHGAIEKSGTIGQNAVNQPVGSNAWGDEIGNRVVLMAGNRESHAELVLTPPQMGRVEVTLSVSGDQASASFVSGNPAVREALESALPRLREILADAGIQLGQAQVGAENPRQTAQQQKNGDNFASASPNDANDSFRQAEPGRASASTGLKISQGLVDVFA